MDTPQEPKKPDFEQALGQLESIVRELEEGQIGLADSLARYEQGVKLLRECHDLLKKAERQVALVSGVDPEGNPIAVPLEDRTDTLEEKARSRSRRRSAPSQASQPGGNEPCKPPEGTALDEPGGLF